MSFDLFIVLLPNSSIFQIGIIKLLSHLIGKFYVYLTSYFFSVDIWVNCIIT